MGSTNNEKSIFLELVRWDFKVERSRAFPNSSGSVVVGAVAGAIVSAKVTGVGDWDTALKNQLFY